MSEFSDLATRIDAFCTVRDWDQFHSPKNLSMALSAEVGELVEHFQWLTDAQSRSLLPEALAEVANEIADVQIYLIRLAQKLGIDIPDAVYHKIEENEKKHPIEEVRGKASPQPTFHNGDAKDTA